MGLGPMCCCQEGCTCDGASYLDDFNVADTYFQSSPVPAALTDGCWTWISWSYDAFGGGYITSGIASNRLLLYESVEVFRLVCLPELDGLSMSVEFDSISRPIGGSYRFEVHLANYTASPESYTPVATFAWKADSGTFKYWLDTTASSVLPGVDPAVDTVKLELHDTSAGGGTYEAKLYINGTLALTHSGISTALTDPMCVVLKCSAGGFEHGYVTHVDNYVWSSTY